MALGCGIVDAQLPNVGVSKMDQIFELTREAAWTTGWLVGLPLAAVLIVSLVVALFQGITNIHDPVIAAVPRILGFGVIACLLAPWTISRLAEFLQMALRAAGTVGG